MWYVEIETEGCFGGDVKTVKIEVTAKVTKEVQIEDFEEDTNLDTRWVDIHLHGSGNDPLVTENLGSDSFEIKVIK